MWLDHCGSSLDFLERPAIQCSVFILLPVQCSLVHRPWISFSALRFSVLSVSLSRVVVFFSDKPIRLGLSEDLFHYGVRACSLFGLVFCVHSSAGSVLFGSSPLDLFQRPAIQCSYFFTSSFSALRSTLDLGSPSTLCIRPVRSLRFNTMWLDHCGSTLDLPVLRPSRSLRFITM